MEFLKERTDGGLFQLYLVLKCLLFERINEYLKKKTPKKLRSFPRNCHASYITSKGGDLTRKQMRRIVLNIKAIAYNNSLGTNRIVFVSFFSSITSF